MDVSAVLQKYATHDKSVSAKQSTVTHSQTMKASNALDAILNIYFSSGIAVATSRCSYFRDTRDLRISGRVGVANGRAT